MTARREGEAAVLVRYLGRMALSRFLIIRPQPGFSWTDPPENNFIDNTEQVCVSGRGELRGNSFSKTDRGNFWSDSSRLRLTPFSKARRRFPRRLACAA